MRHRPDKMAAATLAIGLGSLALGGCSGGETGEPARSTTVAVISDAMQPALGTGDTVEVDTSAYANTAPQAGDVVALRPPEGAKTDRCADPPDRTEEQLCVEAVKRRLDLTFILRIVGGPGDRIDVRRGLAIRNGLRELRGPVATCLETTDRCDYRNSIMVPDGHYYVLGDNRIFASDSRHWGPVSRDDILGRVTGARIDPNRR